MDCYPYLVRSLINLISINLTDTSGVLSAGSFGVSDLGMSGYGGSNVLDDVRSGGRGYIGV